MLLSRVRGGHCVCLSRVGVEVFGDDWGLVTVGRGLAGRREISIEVDPDLRGRGPARTFSRDALGLMPLGEWVFAAVSPGNARSLRLFISNGGTPTGSEVIVRPSVAPATAAPRNESR